MNYEQYIKDINIINSVNKESGELKNEEIDNVVKRYNELLFNRYKNEAFLNLINYFKKYYFGDDPVNKEILNNFIKGEYNKLNLYNNHIYLRNYMINVVEQIFYHNLLNNKNIVEKVFTNNNKLEEIPKKNTNNISEIGKILFINNIFHIYNNYSYMVSSNFKYKNYKDFLIKYKKIKKKYDNIKKKL